MSVVLKIKKLQDDSQDLRPGPRGRSKQTVWTTTAIAAVQAAMAENPQRSMSQLARHHKMDPRTMRHLVREDLGLESTLVIQQLLLTPNAQETMK
jgi:methylphosphotriester-DNA--protein-cysteine methyltransferase